MLSSPSGRKDAFHNGKPCTADVLVDVDLACWSCRGLDSLPYYDSLIGRGIGIIAIAEHWLELYKLSCIHPDYDATGVADGRLNEESSGGIGMIWKKSFGGVPIGGITSD